MRPITLHPVSIFVGAALVGAFMLVSSAMQAPAITQGGALVRPVSQVPLTIDNTVKVAGLPDPKTAIVVKAGVPYTVPQGRILVITALGGLFTGIDAYFELRIDNDLQVTTYGPGVGIAPPVWNKPSMTELPSVVVARAGQAVTVAAGSIQSDIGRAWGYLIDA